MSITYLHKEEPANETTVFCHLIGLVFSSPHINQAYEFNLICYPPSAEGKKKPHLTPL